MVWIYKSKFYQELAEWRERFFPKRRKRVPVDVRLDPISLRQWYIGDGTLWTCKGTSSRIQLCTDSFPEEDVRFLVAKLKELGFRASYYGSRNRVIINSRSVKDFFDYIGPLPKPLRPFYEHKWKPRFLPEFFLADGTPKNRLKIGDGRCGGKILELPLAS